MDWVAYTEIEGQLEENNFYKESEDEWIILEEETNKRKILWQAKDFSIRELLMMKQDGTLDLHPEYQRNYVMNEKQASRLIESVLLDVPLPVIYLNEEKNWSYSVIDWQQRLTSFISFLEWKVHWESKDFRLTWLNVLSNLNKLRFQDLDKELQNKIKTTSLHTIIIKKESNDDIKFEIFERLNTWSIKLNEDEVRNTVYRWPFMNLLSELEDNDDFKKLVRKENLKNRMIYRWMILRFFALYEKTYINYKPSIKQFTNKYLRENRYATKEKIEELRDKFKNTVELVKIVFWENAFRRFIPWDEWDKNWKWAVTRINMAIFDIQMCCFWNYTKNQIVPKADTIREEFINLMSKNEGFISSIEIQTSSRDVLQKRFKIWFSKLEEIIEDSNFQNRVFSNKIKENLFNLDSRCKICQQKILMIDDAEVDHILPFSKWWKTSIENAQITHRYCNRQKNNNTN